MAQWALGVLNTLVNENNHGSTGRCEHCPLEKHNPSTVQSEGLEEGMSTALGSGQRQEGIGAGLKALGLLHSEPLQSHHLCALPRELSACCY